MTAKSAMPANSAMFWVLIAVTLSIAKGIPQLTQTRTLEVNVRPNVIAVSSDRKYIGGSFENNATVYVWDPSSGEKINQLTLTEGRFSKYVFALALSSDGINCKVAAADYQNKRIYLWSVPSGEVLRILEVTSSPTSVALSPDGTKVASGVGLPKVSGVYSGDFTVRLWDAESGTLLFNLVGHTSTYMSAVVFSPDGNLLAGGGYRGVQITIWDVRTGEVHKVIEYNDDINVLQFDPTGTLLAVGSSGAWSAPIRGNVTIYNVISGEPLTLNNHVNSVRTVAFSPDGKFLAAGSDEHSDCFYNEPGCAENPATLKLYDVTSGKTMTSIVGTGREKFPATAFIDDETMAVAQGQEIKIFHLEEVSPTPTISLSRSLTSSVSRSRTLSISVTRSRTPTISMTRSRTPTTSMTRSRTPSISVTPTPTISVTRTRTLSATTTRTPTPTISVTRTRTLSATTTRTPTPTISVTISLTPSTSMTISITPSVSPSVSSSQLILDFDDESSASTKVPSYFTGTLFLVNALRVALQ